MSKKKRVKPNATKANEPSRLKAMLPVLSIIISFFALILSTFNVWKNEIMDFELEGIANSFVIGYGNTKQPVKNGQKHIDIEIIIPVSFVNRGYGDGVIKNLALRVINHKSKVVMKYVPVFEVNLKKAMVGHGFQSEAVVGTFTPFALASKNSIKKDILFARSFIDSKELVQEWEEGVYEIQIFAESTEKKDPKLLQTLNKKITANQIKDGYAGQNQIFTLTTSMDLSRKY